MRSASLFCARRRRINPSQLRPPPLPGLSVSVAGPWTSTPPAPGLHTDWLTAAALIAAGTGNILVIGAETLSRITNWEDRTNVFLFGDGAGAVVLKLVNGRGPLLGWNLGVDGSLVELLYADHGSGIVMRGKEIFRQAVRATSESAEVALDHAGVEASQIALFVPHQANRRIMDAVAERLGIPIDRVASVIDWSGNTSAASIPLALVDAAEQGRLHEGDLVLLAGFGAGMTWASAVLRWGTIP